MYCSRDGHETAPRLQPSKTSQEPLCSCQILKVLVTSSRRRGVGQQKLKQRSRCSARVRFSMSVVETARLETFGLISKKLLTSRQACFIYPFVQRLLILFSVIRPGSYLIIFAGSCSDNSGTVSSRMADWFSTVSGSRKPVVLRLTSKSMSAYHTTYGETPPS